MVGYANRPNRCSFDTYFDSYSLSGVVTESGGLISNSKGQLNTNSKAMCIIQR